MRYLLESYGCQLNMAESNALELLLKGAGFEKTENAEEADAVILNTCSVRKTAENRIWGRLSFFGHIKKTERPIKIIVTGCMAERLKEDLKKDAPYVDAVIGTNDKMGIVSYLQSDRLESEGKYIFQKSYYQEGEFSSYVPIMNGCNNFCAYCIVPYVRGREVSRPIEEILEEVRFLDSKGVREITLLGQNVNSYSYNGITFAMLLSEITKCLDNILLVRFESPHPKDFGDDVIEVIAKEERIAKHIHLPMQSGNSRILNLMNRKTTREGFMALVNKMRERIPSLTFATDVMVGFPTETEEEYEETLSMMNFLSPLEAFMYYYNLREGTPAAKMDGQIEDGEKIRRLELLIDKQLKRCALEKENRKEQECVAIVTGLTRDDKEQYLARNEHNEMISFKPKTGHVKGDVVKLKCYELKGNTYLANEV